MLVVVAAPTTLDGSNERHVVHRLGNGLSRVADVVDPDGVLEQVLARQHGVIARWQALACGLTDEGLRARVSGGRWQRVFRGVYAAFSGPLPRESVLWAAVLRAGAG